jgi:hypothetical protein
LTEPTATHDEGDEQSMSNSWPERSSWFRVDHCRPFHIWITGQDVAHPTATQNDGVGQSMAADRTGGSGTDLAVAGGGPARATRTSPKNKIARIASP